MPHNRKINRLFKHTNTRALAFTHIYTISITLEIFFLSDLLRSFFIIFFFAFISQTYQPHTYFNAYLIVLLGKRFYFGFLQDPYFFYHHCLCSFHSILTTTNLSLSALYWACFWIFFPSVVSFRFFFVLFVFVHQIFLFDVCKYVPRMLLVYSVWRFSQLFLWENSHMN